MGQHYPAHVCFDLKVYSSTDINFKNKTQQSKNTEKVHDQYSQDVPGREDFTSDAEVKRVHHDSEAMELDIYNAQAVVA